MSFDPPAEEPVFTDTFPLPHISQDIKGTDATVRATRENSVPP